MTLPEEASASGSPKTFAVLDKALGESTDLKMRNAGEQSAEGVRAISDHQRRGWGAGLGAGTHDYREKAWRQLISEREGAGDNVFCEGQEGGELSTVGDAEGVGKSGQA